jgi:hypothetical protein
MSKAAEILVKKIKEDLGIDVEPEIRRMWTSYFHDDQGGNKWAMRELYEDGTTNHFSRLIGSPYKVSKCVQKKYRLEVIAGDNTGLMIEPVEK